MSKRSSTAKSLPLAKKARTGKTVVSEVIALRDRIPSALLISDWLPADQAILDIAMEVHMSHPFGKNVDLPEDYYAIVPDDYNHCWEMQLCGLLLDREIADRRAKKIAKNATADL